MACFISGTGAALSGLGSNDLHSLFFFFRTHPLQVTPIEPGKPRIQ